MLTLTRPFRGLVAVCIVANVRLILQPCCTGPIPHTMEPGLRKQGVPSKLNKGVVEVVSDYTVCRKGDRLTPQQVQHTTNAAKVLDCVWLP